eukprot:TRINITY_DN12620_c0_g1_i1.p1 TRINITY_DN12620_c0_g1~~TRINITY_DN12620_c0_g1_i1.p1  ORF type:complete len:100 (-),score=9.19 TRINITY_DN12620_c0_g1_i1:315-614(-)
MMIKCTSSCRAEERAHRPQIAVVLQKDRLHFSLGPKVNGIAEARPNVGVLLQKSTSKKDSFHVVKLCVQVSNLRDVVRYHEQKTADDICFFSGGVPVLP